MRSARQKLLLPISLLLVLIMLVTASCEIVSPTATTPETTATTVPPTEGTTAPSETEPTETDGQTNLFTGDAGFIINHEAYALSDQAYVETLEDRSAILAKNGGSLTLSNSTVDTSGDTSSDSNSRFYGLNAAIVALAGSIINLNNVTINTAGEGASGAYACGTGANVNLENCTITSAAVGSHGAAASLEGIVNLINVNITTSGEGAAAALATIRASGTIVASGGTIITNGRTSPCIYSTSTITVNTGILQANKSQAAIVEGTSAIVLNKCVVSAASICGILLYQNTAGDRLTSESTLTMNGGSLTAAQGPLFYASNTKALIHLLDADLTSASGIFLQAGAGEWGSSGSNGADVVLDATTQKINGTVVLDNISSASLSLVEFSTLNGAINTADTAKSVSLALDKTSTWTVTADSYLTEFTSEDTTLANVTSNGFTVYYDAANSANSWLNGQTISLTGGGSVKPRP
jgi:hypothetical protein